MLILLLAIFSPACTRPLLIEERTRRTQSSKNFPKPTYSWTSRPNVPGWLMRAADQTKTKIQIWNLRFAGTQTTYHTMKETKGKNNI